MREMMNNTLQKDERTNTLNKSQTVEAYRNMFKLTGVMQSVYREG